MQAAVQHMVWRIGLRFGDVSTVSAGKICAQDRGRATDAESSSAPVVVLEGGRDHPPSLAAGANHIKTVASTDVRRSHLHTLSPDRHSSATMAQVSVPHYPCVCK